jgi:hypothetical protein
MGAAEHPTPATSVLSGRRQWLLSALGLLGAASAPAWALESPQGPIVLTLLGKLRMPNDGIRAQFDMAMLEALPQHTTTTKTPWYARPRRFTGPLLRDVLAAAGAQGTTLRMIALNDYRVEMPFDDAQRHDVILARLLDDKPMAVRDKGPLFAVYPFDSKPELRSAIYYSRSAWQLRSIEVF